MDEKNELYFIDNLKIPRDHVAGGSVGLIHPDPPFNSNPSYNVLFKEKSGVDIGVPVAPALGHEGREHVGSAIRRLGK